MVTFPEKEPGLLLYRSAFVGANAWKSVMADRYGVRPVGRVARGPNDGPNIIISCMSSAPRVSLCYVLSSQDVGWREVSMRWLHDEDS